MSSRTAPVLSGRAGQHMIEDQQILLRKTIGVSWHADAGGRNAFPVMAAKKEGWTRPFIEKYFVLNIHDPVL